MSSSSSSGCRGSRIPQRRRLPDEPRRLRRARASFSVLCSSSKFELALLGRTCLQERRDLTVLLVLSQTPRFLLVK